LRLFIDPSGFLVPNIDEEDLIYEGIATEHHQYYCRDPEQDEEDLIYEGIATRFWFSPNRHRHQWTKKT